MLYVTLLMCLALVALPAVQIKAKKPFLTTLDLLAFDLQLARQYALHFQQKVYLQPLDPEQGWSSGWRVFTQKQGLIKVEKQALQCNRSEFLINAEGWNLTSNATCHTEEQTLTINQYGHIQIFHHKTELY